MQSCMHTDRQVNTKNNCKKEELKDILWCFVSLFLEVNTTSDSEFDMLKCFQLCNMTDCTFVHSKVILHVLRNDYCW